MPLLLTIISSIAMLLISLIMLVRANDLGARPGSFWMVRRIGFVLSGFAPWAIVYTDWFRLAEGNVSLTWWHVMFRVGLACVFTTTPYLPPFWKWFFGYHDHDDARGMPRRRSSDRGGDVT